MDWKHTIRKINELKPQEENPRKITKKQKEQLEKSISTFGIAEPICITKDGKIIGGHQRYNLLKSKKFKEVHCWECQEDLTDAQIKELTIRLNKNHAEWDFDILANFYDMEDLLDWGFDLDDFELETVPNTVEADDDVLEPPKEPKTKLGDIYILGNHRLMCGDSTNPEQVKALLNEQDLVLMVTDPPYGVNYDASWRGAKVKGLRAIRAEGKVQNDDQINWALAWHLFPGYVAYVWHAGKYCSEVEKSLTDSEYEIISQVIWVKQHFALSRGDYHWQHEPCWYAVKKGQPHNWQGSRKESTVWEIANLNAFGKNKEDERTCHSTQKPLECMRRPIKNNSSINDGVYDPFCGSGTTLIACEELNRRCFAMELDPAYCDVIIERWQKYRRQMGKNDEFTKENITNSH